MPDCKIDIVHNFLYVGMFLKIIIINLQNVNHCNTNEEIFI